MRTRHLVLSLVMLAVSAGSAHGQEKGNDKKPKRDRNVITQEELEKVHVPNVLQAVRRLRPSWFFSRGSVSIETMATLDNTLGVFVDGVKRGQGLPELEAVAIEDVKELHFLPAEEATTRFGTGYPFGAVDVVTKRG